MADNFLSQLDALDANIPPKNQVNTKDDFMANLDAMDANIPAKATNKASQAEVRKFDNSQANKKSGLDAFIEGAKQGITDIPTGISAYLLRTFPSLLEKDLTPEQEKIYRQAVADYQTNRENEYQKETEGSVSAGFGRFLGSALTPVPPVVKGASLLPNAGKVTQGLVTLGARAGTNAGIGALSPIVGAKSDEEYTSQQRKNAGIGAIAGEGINLLGRGIAKGIAKTQNISSNNLDLTPEQLAVKQALDAENIPYTAGDITQKPNLKKAEVLSENIPVLGLSKTRENQQKAINEAVLNKRSQYQEDFLGKYADYEDVNKIEGALHNPKRAKEAQSVLNKISEAESGQNTAKTIQASLHAKSLNAKIEADKLYNRVEKEVEKIGNPKIKVDETLQSINDLNTNKNIIRDTKLDNFLNEVKANLNENPTYSQLRNFRSDLNDLIAQGTTNQDVLVGNKAVNGYKRIVQAVENDLNRFTGNNKKLAKLQGEANYFYKNNVIPYKSKILTNIINNEAPDTIIKGFLDADSIDKISNVVKRLDEKGKNAIKYNIFQNAIDKSINQTNGNISPAKMAGYLQKYKLPIDALGKDTAKEYRGFAKILRHVERAGQYTENPPTGNRLVGLSLLSGAAGAGDVALTGGLGTASILGSSGLLKFLTTTKIGQKLLLTASNLEQNSPQLNTLINRIIREASKANAIVKIPKADGQDDDELTPIDDDNLTTDDELQPIED